MLSAQLLYTQLASCKDLEDMLSEQFASFLAIRPAAALPCLSDDSDPIACRKPRQRANLTEKYAWDACCEICHRLRWPAAHGMLARRPNRKDQGRWCPRAGAGHFDRVPQLKRDRGALGCSAPASHPHRPPWPGKRESGMRASHCVLPGSQGDAERCSA